MDIKEICEKAGCTEKDIVNAMVVHSKQNQFIHYNAEKEARAQAKALEAQYQALKQENIRMQLLIDNWTLSKRMKEMDEERKASELVTTIVTPIETPTQAETEKQ